MSLKNICFLCGDKIASKAEWSPEHIIADEILGHFGIKQHPFQLINGQTITYSRIKIPSHRKCNNEFGSRYEKGVIQMIRNPMKLFSDLRAENCRLPIDMGPSDSITSIITTWMSKIYYGLFYLDNYRANTEEAHDICKYILDSAYFKQVQQSFKHGYGFTLPGSLFALWLPEAVCGWDLTTIPDQSIIMLKINELVLILCIADGCLTRSYLHDENLKKLNRSCFEFRPRRFSHYLALAHVMAHRGNLPKKPSFIFSEDRITNMSFSTSVANPSEFYALDYDKVFQDVRLIMEQFSKRK